MRDKRTFSLGDAYPVCKKMIGSQAWYNLEAQIEQDIDPEAFPDTIKTLQKKLCLPDYLAYLAQLELSVYMIQHSGLTIPDSVDTFQINPTVDILHSPWRVSATLISKDQKTSLPESGEEWVLIWRDPSTHKIKIQSASERELLSLKIVSENIPTEDVVATGDLSIWEIHHTIQLSVDKGLILKPSSKLVRNDSFKKSYSALLTPFIVSPCFTLQWHVTHQCDMHCKHCYDRSKKSPLTLNQGLKILDDFWQFCQQRYVKGHVCFSGGNPLLSPIFFDLYQAAANRRFSTSILGNPAPREQIEKIKTIQNPSYFQVSLEGLAEHNDYIRGRGSYHRVFEFLGILRDCKMKSAVMLTLTKDNLNQILPLADKLRGHADMFTFNRLSPVGEGANLQLPEREAFRQFLKDFSTAAKTNPIINLKDNLLNLIHNENKENWLGGCTGFGCGAAFSFLAVLPDGETHACRKFPSPLGNILTQTITEVYDSEKAKEYRKNVTDCCECKLGLVCRGCMAVVHGLGGDPFTERDPFCWK